MSDRKRTLASMDETPKSPLKSVHQNRSSVGTQIQRMSFRIGGTTPANVMGILKNSPMVPTLKILAKESEGGESTEPPAKKRQKRSKWSKEVSPFFTVNSTLGPARLQFLTIIISFLLINTG